MALKKRLRLPHAWLRQHQRSWFSHIQSFPRFAVIAANAGMTRACIPGVRQIGRGLVLPACRVQADRTLLAS